ncbi:MAG: asrA [Lacrimispora sp.]|jgi:anaerobic sulfite reductase subunit A|nr:asrA [Lacrimispora sp.]
MGYILNSEEINEVFRKWKQDSVIYAPILMKNGGVFSDTDSVHYGEIQSIEEIVFDQRSDFSFKEILLPISETLFYFTEDSVKEPESSVKQAIIFLRSCDLHAVKRLDTMYLHNGAKDPYYKRLRDRVKFVLMGCKESFDSCFCVDMETNRSDDYHASMELSDEGVRIDNKNPEWDELFAASCTKQVDVTPSYVTETETQVNIPKSLTLDVMKSSMWKQYDSRCINCGRCNFVCPTCTCFTMQDIFYTDNGKVGERRRVWASCMTDGFTDVAGGGSYRQNNGQRMRFKVMHKVYDYKKRNGIHMCVGCGRCDDVCPEYISFSHCINQLEDAMKEVTGNES